MTPPPAILLVCLGNICRSPLAEAAFRAEAARRGLDVVIDSAGTGAWHVGEPPDRRARATARRHGVTIDDHVGRRIEVEDFRRFDAILALDRRNLADLVDLAPRDAVARLSLVLDHVPGREGEDVPDPYYGGVEDFERTWDLVTAGASGFFAGIAKR